MKTLCIRCGNPVSKRNGRLDEWFGKFGYRHLGPHCPESSESQMRSNDLLGRESEQASAPTDPQGEQSKSESAISALGRAPVLTIMDNMDWAEKLTNIDLEEEIIIRLWGEIDITSKESALLGELLSRWNKGREPRPYKGMTIKEAMEYDDKYNVD